DYRVAKIRSQPRDSDRNAIQETDAGTLFDEPRHDRPADPRATARNQRHLTIEPAHCQVLLSGSDGAGPRRRPRRAYSISDLRNTGSAAWPSAIARARRSRSASR